MVLGKLYPMVKKMSSRIPQAPSEPMPELTSWLAQFRPHFRQQRSFNTFGSYLTGLLTDHPNKNCDTIASIIPGTNQQQLNHLTTSMVWDHDELNSQRIEAMLALETEGDGCLIFDDTGFAKQGRNSVGVARQYSGTLGKVGNCQLTVNCHYAERNLAFPLATRLYLPKSWCDDTERMQKAGVPEGRSFKTKAEIALDLLDYANECGVNHSCVTADADYGDNSVFLNGLEERFEPYSVAVRANFSVRLTRAGESKRADEALWQLPRTKWKTIRWREGSQGWLRAKFVALRCWRVDGDGTRHIGWLIGQRAGRGESGESKYFWSNFPANTELRVLVEYAHRRHWVEQYHEEAKGELGWDQYQGKSWGGFHRHAVSVMMSYSFLVWVELKQREKSRVRGRQRQAFSPSQRSAAADTSRSAPPSGRMVEGRSNSRVDRHRSHQSISPNAKLTK
jgi:SRSO17 transposase